MVIMYVLWHLLQVHTSLRMRLPKLMLNPFPTRMSTFYYMLNVEYLEAMLFLRVQIMKVLDVFTLSYGL